MTKKWIPWTNEEIEFLEKNWKPLNSKKRKKEFVEKFKSVSGNERTLRAISNKACSMGLLRTESYPYPLASDVARELGVDAANLVRLVRGNPERFPHIRTNHRVLIKPEGEIALREHYKMISEDRKKVWGELTTAEVAEKIHVSKKYVQRLILFGLLEARKAGYSWKVSERSVREFLEKRNSMTDHDWLKKLVACNEFQARRVKNLQLKRVLTRT